MGGGGIHMQLPYTVLTYRKGALLCYYHTTCVATMQLSIATIQLLVGYQILCGYHKTPGWIPDSVWLPYNSCVTPMQLPCGAP